MRALADAYVILGGNGHRPPADVFPKAKASLGTRAGARRLARAATRDARPCAHAVRLGLRTGAFGEYRPRGAAQPELRHRPALARVDTGWARPARRGTDGDAPGTALDPLSLVITSQIGTMLHYLRRYDEAEAPTARPWSSIPGFTLAHAYLAANHARQGQFTERAPKRGLHRPSSAKSAVRMLGPIQAAAGLRRRPKVH